MSLYLVRHARAGSRSRWKGDDALRPLSKLGRSQAEGIARKLGRKPIEMIVSSPYVRCVATVEPLAAKRKLTVESSDALGEGAPVAEALRLLEKVQDRESVLCTHGDVVEGLLDHFGRHGVKLRDHRMEKGSIWVFDVGANGVEKARYVPPPKST